MSDAAAIISAAGAVLSLLFTIYVYRSTRKLIQPFERPTLSLIEGRVGSGTGGNIGYALRIRNTGQRPATKIRFRARAAPETNLTAVVKLPDWAPAHDYQPGGELELMLWPPASFAAVTMMQVAVSYADSLSNKKYEGEGYWLVVFPGAAGAVTGMNQQQREDAEKAWGITW
jgi:hypothetical protein